MRHLVSVIIPIFNACNTLKRCVDSLLRQTYTHIQILLVNDGSTDDSGLICEEYAKQDKRVCVIHKENGGAASARNEGIRHAVGEYLTFVDADDWVTVSYIDDLLSGITDSDIKLVISELSVIRDGQDYGSISISTPAVRFTKQELLAQAFVNCELTIIGMATSKLFRSKIIAENNCLFDHSLPFGEELAFIKNYMKSVDHITVVHKLNYKYNVRSESLSQAKYKNDFMLRSVLARNYIALVKEADCSEEIIDRYFTRLSKLVISSIENVVMMGLPKPDILEVIRQVAGNDLVLEGIKRSQKNHIWSVNHQIQKGRIKTIYCFYCLRNMVRKLKYLLKTGRQV